MRSLEQVNIRTNVRTLLCEGIISELNICGRADDLPIL